MLSQYRGRGFYDPLSVNEMDRLFSEMFGDFVRRERTAQGKPNGVWAPAIDVAQKDQDLVVRAELPGTKPEDVDISLQNRILTISGTSKGAAEDVDYYVQELPYGEFRCSVMVPEGVNPDSIKARLENGVLEVVLPGMAREARPTKKVAVETGKVQQKEEASIFPTKILLATDGSEEAELALLTAVDLANRTNSELHVVHVGGEYYPGPEIALSPALLEETLRELEREAREVLEEQVKKIEEVGGTVAEAHLRMGERPEEKIVALTEELGAGLIAMGSRGLGGMKRLLTGSVSDSVVRHAHCPVLVVRAEKGSPHYLEESDTTARRPRREGAEQKRSFWDNLLGPYPSGREELVLEYIVHRLGDGAHLEDIVQEEYVRRYASPEEVGEILENPRLVEGARKKIE